MKQTSICSSKLNGLFVLILFAAIYTTALVITQNLIWLEDVGYLFRTSLPGVTAIIRIAGLSYCAHCNYARLEELSTLHISKWKTRTVMYITIDYFPIAAHSHVLYSLLVFFHSLDSGVHFLEQ